MCQSVRLSLTLDINLINTNLPFLPETRYEDHATVVLCALMFLTFFHQL